MQIFTTRRHLVAKNFLSNISFDENLNDSIFSPELRIVPEVRNNADHNPDSRFSDANSSFYPQLSDVTRFKCTGKLVNRNALATSDIGAPAKNVSFSGDSSKPALTLKTTASVNSTTIGEVGKPFKPLSIRHRFNLGSPLRSASTTTNTTENEVRLDFYSCRYEFVAKSLQNTPVAIGSVIPISRDSNSHSGLKSGVGACGHTSTINIMGRPRMTSEVPIFHSIFRHHSSRSSAGLIHTSGVSGTAGSVSFKIGDSESAMPMTIPVISKPLTLLKPVDVEERSFAHLLTSRSLRAGTQLRRCGQRDTETEETTGSENATHPIGTPPTVIPMTATATSDLSVVASTAGDPMRRSQLLHRRLRRREHGRSQTLSSNSVLSVSTTSLNAPVSHDRHQLSPIACLSSGPPVTSGELPLGFRFPSSLGNWRLASSVSTSLDSQEQRFVVSYEDPLLKYDPKLLDDPRVLQYINRRVFTFAGYITSVLGYHRPHEYKRHINREFHFRFPAIQLTLTKMRSLKLALLSVALRLHFDLWIVANAYVLFEKMILKHFVCKPNRKLCAAAAMLISAKLNDVKGADVSRMIVELITIFRVDRRDLLKIELAAFIGLEFSVLVSDEEALPHFLHLHKLIESGGCQSGRAGAVAVSSVVSRPHFDGVPSAALRCVPPLNSYQSALGPTTSAVSPKRHQFIYFSLQNSPP